MAEPVSVYLSAKLVELHGGDITVQSTIGKGSVFSILLSAQKELN